MSENLTSVMDGPIEEIAETYHDQRYGAGLWEGATFQRKRNFRQCSIEILKSIKDAGYTLIETERLKPCDKCDALVTVWLQKDFDAAEKKADELKGIFHNG